MEQDNCVCVRVRVRQVLLEQDTFHCFLLACCLEMVLSAYSSQRTFPWIITFFKHTFLLQGM